MIDAHTHLNFEAFHGSVDEHVAKLNELGIQAINVGTQLETSKKAIEIAEQYPKTCFSTVGIHPIHIMDEEFDVKAYSQLVQHPSVVAVGETGLDYHHFEDGQDINALKKKQEDILLAHMRLAKEFNKPLMVHCWDAYDRLIELFKKHSDLLHDSQKKRGNIHCFIGDWPTAQKFIDLGFVIGFTGIVTFTSDEKLLEVIIKIPQNRFVVETDAPYLTPVPERGKKPNTPDRVRYVAEFIAKRRGVSVDDIDRATTETVRHVFSLPTE